MERLIKAWRNSVRAFVRLSRNEAAFQQELVVLAAALPLAFFIATSWRGYALLIGAILVVMIVEILNTGIEASCNALSREFHIDIQHAKDCGSLAVLISLIIAGVVWGMALIERVTGLSL